MYCGEITQVLILTKHKIGQPFTFKIRAGNLMLGLQHWCLDSHVVKLYTASLESSTHGCITSCVMSQMKFSLQLIVFLKYIEST